MTVQWVTRNVTSPVVKWGTSPAALKRVAGATSGAYTKQDMLDACGWGAVTPPADAGMTSVGLGWIDPGTIHLATLKGLKYNTTYYYQASARSLPFPPSGRPALGGAPARASAGGPPGSAPPRRLARAPEIRAAHAPSRARRAPAFVFF